MKTRALFIVGLGGLLSVPAVAVNGTITINGKVIADTCIASVNGGGASAIVTLPTVRASQLANAGQTAGMTGFSLALTNCPTTGSARAYFENVGVTQTTGYLTNQAAAGSEAQNVEVEILSANNTPIDLRSNTGNNVWVNFSGSGTATLSYSARYIATGAAGGGLVSAALVYSLDYQ